MLHAGWCLPVRVPRPRPKLTVNVRIERHGAGQPQTAALGKPNGRFPRLLILNPSHCFPGPALGVDVGGGRRDGSRRFTSCLLPRVQTRISRLQPDRPSQFPDLNSRS